MSSGPLGIILPGTSVSSIIEKVFSEVSVKMEDGVPTVKLGNGLVQLGDDIMAIKAGTLFYAKPNRFWVETNQKRVFPFDIHSHPT